MKLSWMGAALGSLAGLALGAMTGPAGLIAGAGIGLVIGAIAGRVIEREDARAGHRTRELDAMIGVTEGSLGAPPDSLAPPPPTPMPGDAWNSDWLTPPPPPMTAI